MSLVSAFVAGRPPSNKWWISIVLSPFDAPPTLYTTGSTKHQLAVSIDPFRTRVSLCIRGDVTEDSPKEARFVSMLARFEKKTRVRYRLDRALISGSPAPLKKAVRDWLKNLVTSNA